MIDVSQDIESLTSFKRDSDRLMVDGKLRATRQYQRMADRLSAVNSITRGLAQAKEGLGMSVDECFDQLQADG